MLGAILSATRPAPKWHINAEKNKSLLPEELLQSDALSDTKRQESAIGGNREGVVNCGQWRDLNGAPPKQGAGSLSTAV